MNSWPAAVKRGIDVLISSALLAVLSPLFLLVAAVIRIDYRGPVFFHQERMGINKRKFRVHKFRTMVEGAEKLQAELENLNEADGAAFKIRNDPRITDVGRFLRKTSLDELPQLYNVLKGEMSLVGRDPFRSGITRRSTRTGTGAASASARESPACGRSTDGATSVSRTGWRWTSNTSTIGLCGSI
jgi:lipopolysaccharide/colanic/teichoic acid biosynthesis glycosyltransferase